MTKAKFRALVNAGLTYDEIAEANERAEGWRPSRSSVKYHLDMLNLEPRNLSHKNLIPWKVRPEHNNSELRHMLQAESRSRQGKELSATDRKLVSQLHDHLFGRGRLMVVTYHREVGFGLVPREDCDEDIIRCPRADAYSGDPDGAAGRSTGAADRRELSSHTEERASRPSRTRSPDSATTRGREVGARARMRTVAG